MLYVETDKNDGSFYPCAEVQNGDGTIACMLPDGRYLSLNAITGKWDAPATNIGPWESFKKGGKGLVLDLTWDGVRRTWNRIYDEA